MKKNSLLFIFLLSVCMSLNADAAISFTNGSPQSLTICGNTGSTNLGALLAISGAATGDHITWSVNVAAAHGTLPGFPATVVATASTVSPTSPLYAPSSGFVGSDSFRIRAIDGTDTAYTTIYVTVQAAPVVFFTGSPLYRCTPNDTVTFTATITDTAGIASQMWHFGNGHNSSDTSSLNPATHVYTAPGTYTDSLTVTDSNGCATTEVRTAYVKIAPSTFNINVPVDSGCAPFVAIYNTSITSAPALSYSVTSVDFGDGSSPYTPPAGATSGTHIYTAGGVHTITATYMLPDSAGGCTFTSTTTVKVGAVHPAFTPVFSSYSVCPGVVFSVSCGCSNCSSFIWNFNTGPLGAGSSEAVCDTTHWYSSPGVYLIMALADAGGCIDTVMGTIHVFPSATVSVTATSPVLCYGATELLTAAGIGTGGTYSWFPSTGLSATSGATVTASSLVSTAYTVVGATIHGCADTATINVMVDTMISIHIAGNTSICAGFCDTLSVTGGVASNYIWLPFVPPISPLAQDSVALCTTLPGSTTYTVMYTDLFSCTASASIIVSIHPVNAGAITGAPSVCPGTAIDLADPVLGGTWLAVNGNATVSATGHVTGISAGTDTILYVVNDSCVNDTAIFVVTILPVPAPVILFSGDTLSISIPYAAYQWYDNGTVITGATNATYNPTDTGSYSVMVMNSSGCFASVEYEVASLAVSNINTNTAAINVYPNPTTSVIYISSPIKTDLQLTSIDGRVVIRQNNTKKLDLSLFPDGVYILIIYDGQTGLKIKTIRVVRAR